MSAAPSIFPETPHDAQDLSVVELRDMARAYRDLAIRTATLATAYHEDARRNEAWRASVDAKLALLLERLGPK